MLENNINAFDITVNALKEKGLDSDEILQELSKMFNVFSKSKQIYTSDNEVDEIKELLKEIGVPTNIKGYRYWETALKVYKENPKMRMSRDIYPRVAKIHQDTPAKVERAMRHAVECAFSRCSPDTIDYVFGNAVSFEKGKVTNSEFLTILIEHIK